MDVPVVAWTRRTVPGLGLALAIAAVATAAAALLPSAVGPVLLAVTLGLVVGNLLRPPRTVEPGLTFATRRVLRLGVILLGARLTFGDVLQIGAPAIGVVLVCMIVAGGGILLASRAVGVPPRLACLIGVGTAVCGNTAIMATAPAIDAEDREVSFAVATITVLGTVALLVFPLVGALAGLPDQVFGFWAGLAINDTSQVVAAGAAYSDDALDVATVVKLIRNTFIAPVVLLAAAWAARWREPTRRDGGVRGGAMRAFPLFVVGFLVLAAARSAGVIDDDLAEVFGMVATAAITVAIAAVGVSTRIGDLREVGRRPFLVGAGTTVLLAVVALGFASWLGA